MTSKELRIGNNVWRPCCYDEVVEIRENGIIGLDNLRGLIPYSEIEPIPINEDILLNCGFEKQNDGEYITIYTKSDCIDILCQKKVYYPYNYHYGIFLGKELKYIHELQNVVFALTGQELEIEI